MAANAGERRETLTPSERQSRERSLCLGRAEAKTLTEFKTEPKEAVPVIYYLSRHGQLEHPHLLEVPLSSSRGLLLRDVIKRLDVLRGDGLSRLYSWSSKRRYRNGFVWQDLSDDDLINPSQGQEYILKGTALLLEASSSFRSCETSSSFSESKFSSETNTSSTDSNFPVALKRNNQPWNSLEDLCRSVVYKAKISGESGTNASTQTGERRRRWTDGGAGEECGGEGFSNSGVGRSDSFRSMDCDGAADLRNQTTGKSNRWKASTVLMQLITCNTQN
ncbi:uncharacterized protein LOC111010019 [Momordica charantia]|uniref:Uncharacterized protein LOC111010019 n=1 Tax=Momordica charantia TaxID=3673 RepID=A0A6J1CBK3_MOMCH|nr:uncharacterized protein LOC111010019 [Momordica charantia]